MYIYKIYVNIYTYILDLVLFRIDHNTHVCTYSAYTVIITKIKVNLREGGTACGECQRRWGPLPLIATPARHTPPVQSQQIQTGAETRGTAPQPAPTSTQQSPAQTSSSGDNVDTKHNIP